ncbi:unnamed protein product [Closterium sp. Naga37s-1]|nr:unnamed protein product [Closterium sp. Naga37s-1]
MPRPSLVLFPILPSLPYIQALLTDEAAAAVAALFPPMARGSLPAVCSWADVIGHTKGWAWSAPLHYIDTPDFACSYDERRDCAFAHHPGVCVANAIINYTSQLLTYSPHSSSQPNSYSRRSFPPSSPKSATPLKPAGLPTSPHRRSFLLRGIDEAEAALLGGREEEGEGKEGVAEGGEGEEEMVRVVRRVVQDGARKAAHASILAATAVPARELEAVNVAFESTQKSPARQQEAVDGGTIKRYNLTEALMFLAHFAGDIHQSRPPPDKGAHVPRALCRGHSSGEDGGGAHTYAAKSQEKRVTDVGSVSRGHHLTEALMFLAHFAGDIHQSTRKSSMPPFLFCLHSSPPNVSGAAAALTCCWASLPPASIRLPHIPVLQPLHVGFTSDLGGNRVWDSFIIATAIHLRYNGSSTAMLHHIAHQLASDWRPLIPAWASCPGDIPSRSSAVSDADAAAAASTLSPAQAAACPAV